MNAQTEAIKAPSWAGALNQIDVTERVLANPRQGLAGSTNA